MEEGGPDTPGRGHASNLRRFLAYLKPHSWLFAMSVVAGLAKYNIPVIFPWILRDVIDNVLAGRPSATGLSFDMLMAVCVAIFLVYALITGIQTSLAYRLANLISFDLRKDLFAHLLELPVKFHQSNQTGAIVSRLITDVNNAQNIFNIAGRNLLMDLSIIASITFLIFRMNWKLALISYCVLPFYAAIQRSVSRKMRETARQARARMDDVEGRLFESLSGITEIKAFTHEKYESVSFAADSRLFLDAVHRNNTIYSLLLAITAFLTRLTLVSVIWAGGRYVLGGQLSVGSLMAFYAYLEMIYYPLNRLSELNIELSNSRAAMDRLFEYIDARPETQSAPSTPLLAARGDIRFDKVTFGYETGRPVLSDFDLSIPAGRHVAVVGLSGSGKSTLVKLLIRFMDPWSGIITIDGLDIRGIDLASLRSNIAVVHQEPILFSGTIEENILFGRPGAGRKEMLRATELAHSRAFIEKLPLGFRTVIGERGVELSGGQRQLIAITRAFLKNSPILILDESMSHVDTASEQLILKTLPELMHGRTTILIAHRLSTIIHADSILVMENGVIAQQGSHAQLMADTNGPYRDMFANSTLHH